MTWARSVWMWNSRVSSDDTMLRLAQELGLQGGLGSGRSSEGLWHTGGAAPATQTPWDMQLLALGQGWEVSRKRAETSVLPGCPWRVHRNKEASRWGLESSQVFCHQVQHSSAKTLGLCTGWCSATVGM